MEQLQKIEPVKEINKKENLQTYIGASELIITPEEQEKLQSPVDNNDIEIRPDGLIYYPQVFARDKLNKCIGIGQWALIQIEIIKDPDSNKLFFDGSLHIRGKFVARAIGEQEYHQNNPLQSWASAYEGAKSDCLVRCCKDLGIGRELWQPRFAREWIKENAIKVFVKAKQKDGTEKIKTSWRRKDQEPYWNETGVVPDNNKKIITKIPQKKKIRNYTEEAYKCKTIDELKNWFNSLNPAEKKAANGVKNNRKDEILTAPKGVIQTPKEEEPETTIIIDEMLKNAKTKDNLLVIDKIIDKLESGEEKRDYIDKLAKKITELNFDYEIQSLPF